VAEADRVTPPAAVRAGGGVVWRRDGDGGLQLVLVHRPAYDDWSLPKGKIEVGETEEDAALREVEEETGLRCRLGEELPSTSYHDRIGRPKTVRYWAMTPAAGDVAARHEVDEAVWLPLSEARRRLTYARDRAVLDALGAVVH
jgi:8-oxo-dGTP diphosphatase